PDRELQFGQPVRDLGDVSALVGIDDALPADVRLWLIVVVVPEEHPDAGGHARPAVGLRVQLPRTHRAVLGHPRLGEVVNEPLADVDHGPLYFAARASASRASRSPENGLPCQTSWPSLPTRKACGMPSTPYSDASSLPVPIAYFIGVVCRNFS